LKHLLDCERAGRPCTLETMAGRLEVSRSLATDVLTRLAERGLAVGAESGFVLTEPGRRYALRILRTHRLWERYLADRTGVPAGEWHAEAERVEHLLTEAEAEALAFRLGDPRYDPHGDPIPTMSGEIPERLPVTLARAGAGERVIVRHLEDEPPELFDRLIAAGLAPGESLEVVSRDAEVGGAGRVRVRVRGEERVLGPVEAEQVTVERLPAGESVPGRARTLSQAERGETVRVTRISPACQGPQRRRLLDLGVVPGTRITSELVSASGDPVAYRIRGALIGLRREQAEWIEVEAEPVERAG
ncbi:MAG: FeoA domain-containing protein, partial [Gemmatimonadota bacterium]